MMNISKYLQIIWYQHCTFYTEFFSLVLKQQSVFYVSHFGIASWMLHNVRSFEEMQSCLA
jgi:hypothetical protein